MRRLFSVAFALMLVGTSGGLGTGVAIADPVIFPWNNTNPAPAPVGDESPAQVVYALGGARAPGIPWYDYTMRAGSEYYPNAKRDLIDYPAGAPFSWMPTFFLPPGPRDNVTIGEAARQATNSLDSAILSGTQPAVAVGLSQGTLALDKTQVRLAGDPSAPPPSELTFTTIGDPTGTHAFGQSLLGGIFGPGSYIPFIDYTMPQKVDSQYDTNHIIATYDGLADFPDRPDNLLAVANATTASTIVHTSAAFTGPGDVPPQNIKSFVNSRGATETTYLIPVNHLPLTLPLRYLGYTGVDALDAILQPQIDSGYSRYDNLLDRPVSVDPVNGMDPIAVLDPGTRDSIEGMFNTARTVLPPLG